jgi:hypothetical protein
VTELADGRVWSEADDLEAWLSPEQFTPPFDGDAASPAAALLNDARAQLDPILATKQRWQEGMPPPNG